MSEMIMTVCLYLVIIGITMAISQLFYRESWRRDLDEQVDPPSFQEYWRGIFAGICLGSAIVLSLQPADFAIPRSLGIIIVILMIHGTSHVPARARNWLLENREMITRG